MKFRSFLYLLFLILFFLGCGYKHTQTKKEGSLQENAGIIAVLGFKPALSKGDDPGIIQNPLSGVLVMADLVPQDIADRLTADLFTRIPKERRYHLLSASQTRGVFSSVISSGKGQQDIDIYQKIGQAVSADTILTGYIYRWREREGSSYSVRSPASVSFDLHLIRTHDKAILWKGQFDETQRSLSENIFEMGMFLKGKGKWMTADELAHLGMEEILNALFQIIDMDQ